MANEQSRRLYQRGEDGYPLGSDDILRQAYGPIPEATKFQHGRGYGYEEPAEVHGWQWSNDFGRWSALVTFADGWHGFTYPSPLFAHKVDAEERGIGRRGK
jgi:hypothetical protein